MTVHDSGAAAPGCAKHARYRAGVGGVARVLVTAVVIGICAAGCSLVVNYSCSAQGEAQTARLPGDIAGLRSVSAAEVVSDCDSGGSNVVFFHITSADEAKDEFAGLAECRPSGLPQGEPPENGYGFRCDFPSGPTSVYLVRNLERESSQALAEGR